MLCFAKQNLKPAGCRPSVDVLAVFDLGYLIFFLILCQVSPPPPSALRALPGHIPAPLVFVSSLYTAFSCACAFAIGLLKIIT